MCEKCQDVGIIDLDKAGLFSKFCDCEIGRAILEKKRAIYGIPEDVPAPLTYSQELADEVKKIVPGDIIDGSNDRIESVNTDTGSGDTSKPKQLSKPKKKKKTRKRAR